MNHWRDEIIYNLDVDKRSRKDALRAHRYKIVLTKIVINKKAQCSIVLQDSQGRLTLVSKVVLTKIRDKQKSPT